MRRILRQIKQTESTETPIIKWQAVLNQFLIEFCFLFTTMWQKRRNQTRNHDFLMIEERTKKAKKEEKTQEKSNKKFMISILEYLYSFYVMSRFFLRFFHEIKRINIIIYLFKSSNESLTHPYYIFNTTEKKRKLNKSFIFLSLFLYALKSFFCEMLFSNQQHQYNQSQNWLQYTH